MHANLWESCCRVNDSLSCGCKLLPQQNLVVQDNGGGAASSAAKSSSAPISQKQPATDSFVKDEYENYYIEQNTTKYVKLQMVFSRTMKIRKIFLGQWSGCFRCMHLHSYLYSKGQELFVTVSMLPPTLSGDATIFHTQHLILCITIRV